MTASSEVTVIIKDSDKTFRQKFLHYRNTKGEDVHATDTCPVLRGFVEEAIKNYGGDVCAGFGDDGPDIIIKINFNWWLK